MVDLAPSKPQAEDSPYLAENVLRTSIPVVVAEISPTKLPVNGITQTAPENCPTLTETLDELNLRRVIPVSTAKVG